MLNILLPIPTTCGLVGLRFCDRHEGAMAIYSRGDYRPATATDAYRTLAANGLVGRTSGSKVDSRDLIFDREIDDGRSWQLPVALADHFRRRKLPATGVFGDFDAAVFATGALTETGAIEKHDYALGLKFEAWREKVGDATPCLYLLPPSPGRELDAEMLRISGAGANSRILLVDDLETAVEATERWIRDTEAGTDVAPRLIGRERRRLAPPGRLLLGGSLAFAGFIVVSVMWNMPPAVTPRPEKNMTARHEVAEGTLSPANFPSPVELTPTANLAPVPHPQRRLPAIEASALVSLNGGACPLVELDTGVLRAVPLAVDDDFVVALPNDLTICAVQLGFAGPARGKFHSTAELRRVALLFEHGAGGVQLRPRGDTALSGLTVRFETGGGKATGLLRFEHR